PARPHAARQRTTGGPRRGRRARRDGTGPERPCRGRAVPPAGERAARQRDDRAPLALLRAVAGGAAGPRAVRDLQLPHCRRHALGQRGRAPVRPGRRRGRRAGTPALARVARAPRRRDRALIDRDRALIERMEHTMLLDGRNAIVYGGAGRVGTALATAFAREGAPVPPL